jgi:hypothetical protein
MPPAETLNIDTLRIPYPTIHNNEDIWVRFIRAEETLVAATLLLVALVKGVESEAAVPSFNQSLSLLEGVISHQLATLPELSSAGPTAQSPEAILSSSLHALIRVRLMSARIKVHRYRAFMDDPRMLKRFETITTTHDQTQPMAGTRQFTWDSEQVSRIFPFTEAQSRDICLDAATSITTDLKQLSTAGTIAAPSVCSATLAGYTLMMMSHFQSSSMSAMKSSSPMLAEVKQQCKTGVKTALEVLGLYSTGSDFLGGLRGKSWFANSLPMRAMSVD